MDSTKSTIVIGGETSFSVDLGMVVCGEKTRTQLGNYIRDNVPDVTAVRTGTDDYGLVWVGIKPENAHNISIIKLQVADAIERFLRGKNANYALKYR